MKGEKGKMRIRKKTKEEIENEKTIKRLQAVNADLEAKLEYVAIMADVDIDIDQVQGEENV